MWLTGKGNLQSSDDPECRKCGRYAETGKYVALVCTHGEQIGRRWGTWENMDDRKRWAKKEKDERDFTRSIWWGRFSLISICVDLCLFRVLRAAVRGPGNGRGGGRIREGPGGAWRRRIIYSGEGPAEAEGVEEEGLFRLY